MSSKEKSQGASSAPAFRLRGLTVLLVCTLTVNVLLVAFAAVMSPGEANAEPSPAAGEAAVTPQPASTDQPAQVAARPQDNAVQTPNRVEPTVVRPVDKNVESSRGASENPTLVAAKPPQTHTEQPAGSSATFEPDDPVVVSPGPELVQQPVETATPEIPLVQPEPVLVQPEPVLVQPEPAVITTPQPPTLLVVNPASTGGTIYYLVDGKVYSLAPGQEHDLGQGPPRRIEFHRGGSYGEASLLLDVGTYYFHIGNNGWSLTQAAAIVE